MKQFVCGIIGEELIEHEEIRATCPKLVPLLYKELEELILRHHVTEFISGMQRGAEMLAAEIVLELKKGYPVTLWGILESEEQWVHWNRTEQNRFFSLMEQADFLLVLAQTIPGSTRQVLTGARRRGKRVLWIEPETLRATPYLE